MIQRRPFQIRKISARIMATVIRVVMPREISVWAPLLPNWGTPAGALIV
jgi:hypothetical protein